ncbi:MAG: OmpH family outer membrane protein [Victivallaceae bacterium]|nr:OmpH family outer membrane protein [Victivallaceae bacterium]
MRIKSLIAAALICLSVGAAAAEPFRAAVIDMEKVFNNYYKTKIIQSQLEEQQNVYRTHLTALNKNLQTLQEEYRTLLDAAQNITLKETDRQLKSEAAAKKLAEMNALKTEMENYFTEKTRSFQQLEESRRNEVTGEILAEVQRRATVENYDLVFDYSGKTTTNLGSVVFFKSNLDITEKVLEELNRGNRTTAAAPQKTE